MKKFSATVRKPVCENQFQSVGEGSEGPSKVVLERFSAEEAEAR